MNQFFLAVISMCILLLMFEYVWAPIWFLPEDHTPVAPNSSHRGNKIIPKPAVKKVILSEWSRDTPIVFMHIGKAAGTSFDQVIPPILGGLGMAVLETVFFICALVS